MEGEFRCECKTASVTLCTNQHNQLRGNIN